MKNLRCVVTVLFVMFLVTSLTGQIKNFKFEIETLGGQKLTQEDFKDNVVLVDFWGTWCPPCRKAIPDLVELYKKYKHHGLEIVGLNYREQGGKRAVREYAIDNGITYHLAMGTNDIKKQVLGFRGYPTMLFFKKGMKYSHLEVGYKDGSAKKIESWVRKALGLDAGGDDDEDKEEPVEGDEEGDDDEEEKDEVEEGRIYRPGNHDKGFAFEAKGLDGKDLSFADYKGKKVVLAMTSTWDEEAANTAEILNTVHKEYGAKGVAVLAASIADRNTDVVKDFVAKHKVGYTVFPTDLKFLRKLHRPGGLPTFLVFDKEGTLILRLESQPKDKVLKSVRDALEGRIKAAEPKPKKPASKPASRPTSRKSEREPEPAAEIPAVYKAKLEKHMRKLEQQKKKK